MDDPTFSTLRLPLQGQVDDDLASDIEKQSVYVSQALHKLRVDLSSSEVELTFHKGADVQVLCAKVSRFLQAMVRGYRKIETTVHYTRHRPSPRPYVADVHGEPKQRGWLHEPARAAPVPGSADVPTAPASHAQDTKEGRLPAWFRRWRWAWPAWLRARRQPHEALPTNRHELRDLGLLDRGFDRPSPGHGRGDRTGGRDPYSW